MEPRITAGNEPLESTGLVAFPRCGHWWVYPVAAIPAQMHDLARFDLGVTCSFCVGGLYAATQPHTRAAAGRVN